MRKLAIVLAVLIILVLSMLPRACDAAPPTHAGEGGPPPHARNGKAVKVDPDDNGKGPERGDGTADLEDWNNGCGNDSDFQDDNEGWCKGHKKESPVTPTPFIPTPVPPLPTPTPPVVHNCTVYLYGNVIEVFEGNVSVRNPDSEAQVLAEANGFLEFHGRDGATYQILWWDSFWGHADSPVTEFVCSGTITLYEPPLRPWLSPPQLKWR